LKTENKKFEESLAKKWRNRIGKTKIAKIFATENTEAAEGSGPRMKG
jgi:hypothetical protein